MNMNEASFWAAYRTHLSVRRAPRTVTTYVEHARAFLEFAKSRTAPTASEVEGFLSARGPTGRERSIPTRNQMLAALRVLGAFALRDGHWTANPAADVAFLREPQKTPAVLSRAEVTALVRATADDDAVTPTDRALNLALVVVLVQTGLRVGELTRLDQTQVDFEAGLLRGVIGKGGSLHDVVLSEPATRAIRGWLAARATDDNPRGVPALFTTRSGTRISVRTVQRRIRALGSKIRRRIGPHSLRHSSATAALSMGVDVSTVSDHLRHASLTTTQRYLHFSLERRRAAADKLGSLIPSDVFEFSGENKGGIVRYNSPLDVDHDLGDNIGKAA